MFSLLMLTNTYSLLEGLEAAVTTSPHPEVWGILEER